MRCSALWELLFWFVLLVGPTTAAQAQEFRRVKMADGSTYSGIVKAGDADNLVLETLTGDVNLPLMDIIQIEPLDRETLLHETDGYLLCLPLPPGTAETEDALGQRLCMAMRRDLLDPVPFDHLTLEQQGHLRGCHDMACSATVAAQIDAGYLLEAQVAPSSAGYEVSATLYHAKEGEAHPVRTARVAVHNAQDPSGAIARCTALLLGEKTDEAPEVSPEEPVTQGTGEAVAGVDKTARSPRREPSPEETNPEPAEEAPEEGQAANLDLRRYDLIPVPGLVSSKAFRRPGGTAIASGAVVAITGLTVYVIGDLRVVGSDRGLSVPWTYENRGIKDGALLTGAGVATYCLTTWVANVLVRKYLSRKR